MARTDEQALRACPTCGGDVEPGQLGLQDYRWLGDVLPDRIGPSDIDFILDQVSTGRILILEFKENSKPISMGQRLLLKALVRLGCDVWVVWVPTKDGISPPREKVRVGAVTREGGVPFSETMTRRRLAGLVREWWVSGMAEASA